MISNPSLWILGLLLLNISIFVQSIPVKVPSSSSNNNERKKFNIQETSAHPSDNVNELDENSEINMNSNDFINLLRKRRNVPEYSNKRQKRSFYESLLRPSPATLERNIRLAADSLFDEPLEWNQIYPNTMETDDTDLFQISDYDDESDYEYNHYPISLEIPYDNLQLQQEYNTDDIPMDDDEVFFAIRYDPFDDYFK